MAIRGRSHVPYFLIGILSGCVVTLLTTTSVLQQGDGVISRESLVVAPQEEKIERLLTNGFAVRDDDADNDDDADVDDVQPLVHHTHDDDSPLSRVIYNNVRIFCWIMTSHNNTYKKAVHVNATWAPRCNKYVFITSDEDSGLPTVSLNVTEGRQYLWMKTKEAFKWIYNNELNNYDWFLKADDDTFVVIENLRFMLLAYSPSSPIYFGCRFKKYMKQGYMSGGAGYVLSREAVKRFVEDSLTDSHKCKSAGTGAEDAEIGKCLQNVGVIAGDSRDGKGRHRMLPFGPASHLSSNHTLPKWFHNFMFYPYTQGEECCSDYMISYHYINTATMYTLDFLIYHLRPYGLVIGDIIKDDNKLDDKSLLEYARQRSISNSKALDSPVPIVEAEAAALKKREKQLQEQQKLA